MKTPRSVSDSGHENQLIIKIGDRTGSWISADVIHPTWREAGVSADFGALCTRRYAPRVDFRYVSCRVSGLAHTCLF